MTQPIIKAKEQAHQFAEVLSMTYGLNVAIHVRIHDATEKKVETLLKTVADYFGVSVHQITSKGRQREKVEPRMVAITLIYRTFKLEPTLKKTALWFGGQHHSTIMHAMKAVDDLCAVDRRFALDFNTVTELVDSKIGTP